MPTPYARTVGTHSRINRPLTPMMCDVLPHCVDAGLRCHASRDGALTVSRAEVFRGFHAYLMELRNNDEGTADKCVLDMLRITHFFQARRVCVSCLLSRGRSMLQSSARNSRSRISRTHITPG